MPRAQKRIQQPKRNRGDDKQVYRRDTVGMIAKEGLPALPWWPVGRKNSQRPLWR
jgi:hypothetical protein